MSFASQTHRNPRRHKSLPTNHRQCLTVTSTRYLSPVRVLAVILFFKNSLNAFIPPDFVASSPGMVRKRLISLGEVTVYGLLAFVDRLIVTIVDNGSCQPAENRFNNIQKLSADWKWHELNQRGVVLTPEPVIGPQHTKAVVPDTYPFGL